MVDENLNLVGISGGKWLRDVAHSEYKMRLVENITIAILLICAAATFYYLTSQKPSAEPLSPILVASLLVGNLLPATFCIILLGRRLAIRRSAKAGIGSKGQLHIRLVAIFSLLATIPMLLLVIFSSILFQSGVQFWSSSQAKGVLQNASALANGYYEEKIRDVEDETVTMAGDVRFALDRSSPDDPKFLNGYLEQVLNRKLSQSAIITVDSKNVQRTSAFITADNQGKKQWISDDIMKRLRGGERIVVSASSDKIEAVTVLYDEPRSYLYAARSWTVPSFLLGKTADNVLSDYESMVSQSRKLQIQFNIALYIVAILIVGIAIWVALFVADRMVRPVTGLVLAAQKVADGDLSARVETESDRGDEIAVLGQAFNQMTERLEDQTGTLVRANAQLNNRREFIEAILSSVSAAIISLDDKGVIQLSNASADKYLEKGADEIIGAAIHDLSPKLAELFDQKTETAIVREGPEGEEKTLAVRLSFQGNGAVLTFEDISQQLSDQRRAAWSDVARRIAHEIKNPLTPIQLAAERLQRRFGKQLDQNDEGTAIFKQLTETIVRQVGDLRKIVDEFSSFARMPKPIFRDENLHDIVKQAIFMHEVAHPHIKFTFDFNDHHINFTCDRRQLAQAFTNLIKNAVESVDERILRHQQSGEEIGFKGAVHLSIHKYDGRINIIIKDNGIGIDEDSFDSIFEPYVTNRAQGSGLGLAIVKKIIDEHFGDISFNNMVKDGAQLTIKFDLVKPDNIIFSDAQDKEARGK
ncbi:hypothetical protein LPB140_07785 [Sphingorhabdus lutea]|uniref:histidine kinase n=1 Tax=Sphingorhabdus lutea TaxID=1913578 RepID=A0A1L3JC58_9SPHN|nr:ATP-binding protein [Sphingorhabdus lutea]APG62708.1 hypothetical protein LPB140_07785 [Sphingorhabdus lutea]